MLRGGLIAYLFAAGLAHAADAPQCERYKGLQFPAADKPSSAEAAALGKCSPTALYYGTGGKVDFVKARHCAFMQPDETFDPSNGVLMMVYANGQGVPRNYELAKKAACETWSAPAELEARFEHLKRMQSDAARPSPKMDLCDDITSGLMGGVCESIRVDLATRDREIVFEKLTSKWAQGSRDALAKLRSKAEVFFVARAGGEVDQSGSARVAFLLKEENRLRTDFLRSLQAFEAGRLPSVGKREFAETDRELNAAYQRLRRTKDPEYAGAVKMVEIVAAQRVWLDYRDEWVKFGRERYPAVSHEAWMAYFTGKRVRMLRELLKGRDLETAGGRP
jgi:uncharacterized protein YecT (DUF1311 family)